MSDENANPNWTFGPKESTPQPVATTKKGGSSVMKYAIIAIVFFAVGFVISGSMTGKFVGTDKMQTEQLKGKVTSYVSDLLGGESNITIEEIAENNGLYEVKMNIDGKSFSSFVSFNGKLLFPSALDMDAQQEQQTQTQQTDIPKTAKPTVELFVMSFCPYGIQAEDLMQPVIDLLGDKVTIIPQYVLSADGNTVSSLHGQYEVDEDERQLCIMEEYNAAKLWEYLNVFNGVCNKDNLETCWKEKAEEVSIDVSKIETCLSEKGEELLKEQATISSDKQITGSPTLLINGVKYTGSRTSEAYKQAICSAFTEAPTECSGTISASGTTQQTTGNC